MQKPESQEYKNDTFFEKYILNAVGSNALEQLLLQKEQIVTFYQGLGPSQIDYAYALEKWTFRELLGHITDTELILQFRLLSALRAEKQTLNGFDENNYMVEAHFKDLSLELLLENYKAVRSVSIQMLKSATDIQLNNKVNISDYFASGRSLAWFMVGHEQHHIRIMQTKYKAAI
jgi:hypothetical protein